MTRPLADALAAANRQLRALAALADKMETDGYQADSDGWGHIAAREIRHELGLEPECRCTWATQLPNPPKPPTTTTEKEETMTAPQHPRHPATQAAIASTNDITQLFTTLGNTISSIHQGIVILASQVQRLEQLRTDLAEPDYCQGELLSPERCSELIAAALDGREPTL